jgi:plastocyanin domain-containing protein
MNKNFIIILVVIAAVALLVAARNYMDPASAVGQRPENPSNPSGSGSSIINLGLSGGNYNPRSINLEYGKPVTFRNDGTLAGCANYLVQSELGIRANFAQNKEYTFTPQKEGSFIATCSMGMYKTTINVA